MNRHEKANDFESDFKRSDEAGKLKLVTMLRVEAIEFLAPAVAHIQRPMSDAIREKYAQKGISTDWNFDSLDDVVEFHLLVQQSDLPSAQKNAASLLRYCTDALEYPSEMQALWPSILNFYRAMDHDEAGHSNARRVNQFAAAGHRNAEISRWDMAWRNKPATRRALALLDEIGGDEADKAITRNRIVVACFDAAHYNAEHDPGHIYRNRIKAEKKQRLRLINAARLFALSAERNDILLSEAMVLAESLSGVRLTRTEKTGPMPHHMVAKFFFKSGGRNYTTVT